jgi:hypothetical protein
VRRKSKIVQTCCGGIPLRNGRCSVCGDVFPEDEDLKVLCLPRTRKRAKSFNEPFTSARV